MVHDGLTAEQIASKYGVSPGTVKNHWRKRPDWPAPIGRCGRAYTYPSKEVDAVVSRIRQPPREEGVTLEDVAVKYGASLHTVRHHWAQRDNWPAPIGRRGRAYTYDPDQVDGVARKIRGTP